MLSEQVVQLQEELHLARTSIAEKTVLQTRLEELEKQLAIAEAQLKEEVCDFQNSKALKEEEKKYAIQNTCRLKDWNLTTISTACRLKQFEQLLLEGKQN